MSTPSMRTPRSRPPGFATARGDESSHGVVAREPDATSSRDADSGASLGAATEIRPRSATRGPRQEALTPSLQPVAPPVAGDAPPADASAYAGAATRQFNTRLLEPLHRRYMRLVRDLADEGYETSMTELVHALLHD